jgi:hypothetical protein
MVINRKASSNASTSATVHKGNLKVTKNSSQNFSSVNSAKLANKEIVIVAEE